MNDKYGKQGQKILRDKIMSKPYFIKLFNAYIEKWLGVDNALLITLQWCLKRANFEDVWLDFTTGSGSTEIFVKSGQFVTSRNHGAKETGLANSTFYEKLKKLSRHGIITTQSPNKSYTLVTICDYETLYKGKVTQEPAANSEKTMKKPAANIDIDKEIEKKNRIIDNTPVGEEAIVYLNLKAKKEFKPISVHLDRISQLLHEGYSLADIKSVIDKKTIQWLGTEREKFLRPETLFSMDKFDSYKNEPKIGHAQNNKKPSKESLGSYSDDPVQVIKNRKGAN